VVRLFCDKFFDKFYCYFAEIAPSSNQGVWPFHKAECPEMLVCTPAFLSNFVRGPVIIQEELFQNIRVLVMDEVSRVLRVVFLIISFNEINFIL